MKIQLIVLAIAAGLAGCSSTATRQANTPIPSPTPAVSDNQKLATPGRVGTPMDIDVPAWYIKAPASTDEYVFISGTGVSNDLSMSRAKAMLDAQHQLADKLNGIIDSVVRQRKIDSAGNVTSDYTSKVTRKTIIETSLTGHHLEDTRVQAENRGYRTFVLLRYPIGDANQLLKSKQQREQESKRLTDDETIDKEISKGSAKQVSQSKVEPVVATATPVPINELKLIEVDNEEYKRRRAEALQKPGAVVGNITLR